MRFLELVKDKVTMLYSNKIHRVNGFMVLTETKSFLMDFFYLYVNVTVFMVKLSFFFCHLVYKSWVKSNLAFS